MAEDIGKPLGFEAPQLNRKIRFNGASKVEGKRIKRLFAPVEQQKALKRYTGQA
jgi:hypothetical protein